MIIRNVMLCAFLKLFFLIVLVCSFCMINPAQANPLPFYDTDGNAIELSKLKGKWVVINYWASWCGICVEEIPELNRFYQAIKGSNIVFYGVDYDSLSLENLKSSMASLSIKYPVLASDPGEAWNLGSIDVVPTTFIINPEGQVVKIITGASTERSLLGMINSLQQKNDGAK